MLNNCEIAEKLVEILELLASDSCVGNCSGCILGQKIFTDSDEDICDKLISINDELKELLKEA